MHMDAVLERHAKSVRGEKAHLCLPVHTHPHFWILWRRPVAQTRPVVINLDVLAELLKVFFTPSM